MDNPLPEVLKGLRLNKGVSQKKLAEFLNIDRTTYTKYETGDSSPDYDKLIKLANFFRVPLDFLLGRGDIYDVGRFLKEEREEQGFTENELAAKIGVDVAVVLEYEENDIPLSSLLYERILSVFGISSAAFSHKYGLYDEYIPEHFAGDVDAYEAFKEAERIDAMSEGSHSPPLPEKEARGFISPEEAEFKRWVEENVSDVFFYDFDKSPEESKRQLMKDLKYMWEREKKYGKE